MKRIIKRRAVFAEIHQDTRGAGIHTFSIKYRKKDGSAGYKAKVSKSYNALPGDKKFRQNVNINHVLLLKDQETGRTFEVLIDLLIEYNGMLIDHTT